MSGRRRLDRTTLLTLFVAALAVAQAREAAQAQGKLDARYTITVAGVPVARGAWVIDIGEDQFTAAASGRTTGLLRVVSNGQGSVASRGRVVNGSLVAASYAINSIADHKTDEVSMALAAGAVKDLFTEPPVQPAPDRVPVADAHRRGVVDPMTAALVAVGGNGDPMAPESCSRTLPIFDGRQRLDIVLAFKRMDKVKAAKGYQGHVLVCSVAYRPVSGHRPDRPAIQYLTQQRDMEVWLAPVFGTRVLVPFRVSVPTPIGIAVLEATQFVTTSYASRPAAATNVKTQ